MSTERSNSLMQEPNVPAVPLRGLGSDGEPACSPLGVQLKCYFDGLTQGPVPDRLLRLTEQLEAALERGELRCGADTPRRR